jgi:hypothetical protein
MIKSLKDYRQGAEHFSDSPPMSRRSNRDRNDNDSSTTRSLNSSIMSQESLREFGSRPEPKSPYNAVAQSLRRVVPQNLACRLGCNGKKCKYDNSDWPPDKMALPGLFSHWYSIIIMIQK